MHVAIHIACAVTIASAAASAAIMDRVAVSVGNEAIREAQIDQEVRVTELLNGTPVDLSIAEKRKAASRLIDQAIIRAEMARTGYRDASATDVAAVLAKLKKARFGSESAYRSALLQYGVSDAEFQAHVAWQLTVVRFVDARFQQRKPLPEQRVNSAFFSWLDQSRKRARIAYRDEALQ